jgi:hypothetical protein
MGIVFDWIKYPQPIDCSVYARFATRLAPAKFLDTAIAVIAKQTAMYCNSSTTLKKVRNWPPSARKPHMK